GRFCLTLVDPAASSGQRNGRGDARLITDHPRGVPLAGEVLGQVDVAGAKAVDGSVPEPDFHLAGEGDHELASRGGVPINEITRRGRPELNAHRVLQRAELGMRLQIHPLDVRLSVGAAVQARDVHPARVVEARAKKEEGAGTPSSSISWSAP